GVDLGDGAEAVEVEPAVGQDAVDALANAAAEAVDDVVDGGGAVQGDAEQVAEFARVMTAAGFLDCEPFRLPARRPTHRRIGYRGQSEWVPKAPRKVLLGARARLSTRTPPRSMERTMLWQPSFYW